MIFNSAPEESSIGSRWDPDKRAQAQIYASGSTSGSVLVLRGQSINITKFDAETRFRALAGRGSVKKGIAILDKLDAAFATPAKPTKKKENS